MCRVVWVVVVEGGGRKECVGVGEGEGLMMPLFHADGCFCASCVRVLGMLGWAFMLLSIYIIAWIGFSVFPEYLTDNKELNSGAVYGAMGAFYAVAMVFTVCSKSGVLFLLSTVFSALTPFAW